MGRCFEESHAAYAAHDGARAKELSEEGKAHKREMERLNAEAAEWIFTGQLHSAPAFLVLLTSSARELARE